MHVLEVVGRVCRDACGPPEFRGLQQAVDLGNDLHVQFPCFQSHKTQLVRFITPISHGVQTARRLIFARLADDLESHSEVPISHFVHFIQIITLVMRSCLKNCTFDGHHGLILRKNVGEI